MSRSLQSIKVGSFIIDILQDSSPSLRRVDLSVPVYGLLELLDLPLEIDRLSIHQSFKWPFAHFLHSDGKDTCYQGRAAPCFVSALKDQFRESARPLEEIRLTSEEVSDGRSTQGESLGILRR